MKVAIAGFGMEGKSSLDYFRGQGNEVVVLDENPEVIVPEGVQSILGEEAFKNLGSFDLIVRSSGLKTSKITSDNPGIKDKITSQLNEFLKSCPSKNLIGVTGTKGKGTTSTLIAKMLEASGKHVVLAGNIGVPMLNMLSNITPDTFVVLELSSFQLSDLNQPSPHIAICLMMSPEHLDWHGDLDSYVAAKANLFSHQSNNDLAVFFAENDLSKQIAGHSPGQKIPYFSSPGAFVKDDQIMIEDQIICSITELKLLGEHNWQNICAAVTAVWQLEKNVAAIKEVLTSFSGLEHRIEFVREMNGVRYYNDSYASQPKATEAAIAAVPGNKVVIVGGFDRMLDLTELSNFILGNQNSIRKLLLIGASGPRLAESLVAAGFNNFDLASDIKTMPEIVDRATSLAEPGDAVVLSPGFASFDMFKNFEERGLQFKKVVKSLAKYKSFIFKSYSFDSTTRTLDLCYGYDDDITFHEIYKFDFDFTDYDPVILDRALQLLFFIAGVSYYKMYLSPNIKVDAGQIDEALSSFLSHTYEKGLGEFFYVNGLDPKTKVDFPINSDPLEATGAQGASGQLLGLGGGKDSLLSVELLRDQPKIATWSLNHRAQLEPLVNKVGLNHLWVEREWDPQIMELNNKDALNGHIPISAIFSAVGLVTAILSGYKDVVVSNENSASEPTLIYDGIEINHQYSKSLEYETSFQTELKSLFGDSLNYYSLLRPFSELRIAEYFAPYFDKYSDVFSSCNRAFTIHQNHMFWCGECPKCAFVFLILTPFVDKDKLTSLWQGKNLLLDPNLETTYKRLLGLEGDKPLDCVGEVKEARTAMRLAKEVYPELGRYEFDVPEDYDYKVWSEYSMPEEVFKLLKEKLS